MTNKEVYEYNSSDYQQPDGKLVKLYHPIVEVKFIKRGLKVPPFSVACLLDSGADSIVMPVGLADRFGVKYKQYPKVKSSIAGGGITFFYRVPYEAHKIDISIQGVPVKKSIDFSDGQCLPLLGQDFFESFKICFYRHEKKFSLEASS